MFPRDDRRRGAALLVAIAGTALVATIALAVARWTLAGERLALATGDALAADALVRSGVAMAGALLEDHAARREANLPAGVLYPSGLERPLGTGVLHITIEDAARRLDLGAPQLAGAVRRLFAALGLPDALADALGDWIDADDRPRPHGAERAWYLGLRPPLIPRNAPLASVAELLAIRGFDGDTLARVRPFVTTAGERAVNPNTAPFEVLAAWLDEPMARDLVARRRRGAVACTGLPTCTTTGAFYLVRIDTRVHGIRRDAEATLWVPGQGRAEVRALRALDPDEQEAG